MKKLLCAFSLCIGLLSACNNEAGDSVEKADSTNEVKTEQQPSAIQTDSETTDFLVKAADGGMAEVNAGQMGEAKAQNPGVKRFAAMMVQDHTGANAQVKALAATRNVTLPAAPSNDHQKKASAVSEKTGADFDKAYMDMMVDDHKNTIDLFESAEKDAKDTEVRNFISATLPKLRMHLDSAQVIRKSLK